MILCSKRQISKQLHRAETKDRRDCVLEVGPILLENLYLDNPDAISESPHSFEIGLILIEIALDSPADSDLVKLEDLYLYASNKLPLGYKALGSK